VSAPLEQLKPGVAVTGLDPSGPVVVVTATMSGDQACSLVIRTSAGDLRDTIVFRDKEPDLTIEGPSAQFSFTADGELFRLASEAQRIRLAYLFDPMQAVFSSTIQPLPHQIRAVYQDMLPRQPLRYLLADDPGAGKTIMAGLLIKELMLRGTIQRCLIVAPGSLVQQWQEELDEKFGLPFDILTRSDVDNARTLGRSPARSSVEEVLTRSPATFGPTWTVSRHFRRPNAAGRTAGATGGLDQRVEESTASDPTTSASCRHSRPAFRSGATVLRRSCLRSAGDRGRRHRGPASPERAGSAIEGIGFMPWTALQRKASDPLTLAPGSGTQSRERRNLTRHRSTKDCRCWPGIVGPGHNPIF